MKLISSVFYKENYERSEEEYLTAIAMEKKPTYYANLGVLYHR
jgi:hypothetical protein